MQILNFNSILSELFDALPADFILADLGLSSHHLETDDRGFSFMSDVTLGMRMHQEQEITAKEILNNYSEEDLIKIFKNYGNVSFAVSLSRDIIDKRKIKTGRPEASPASRHCPVFRQQFSLAQYCLSSLFLFIRWVIIFSQSSFNERP